MFVGAGGWALKLLQNSGIPEIKGYGVFPIGGQFLKTTNPKVVAQHKAKVYSQASVGAPPMSVPHLDTRVVGGESSLMFGPFATFSPKFLKNGSMLDIVSQVRPHNLLPMLQVAVKNPDLITYLVGELLKNHAKKVDSLRTFMPTAKDEDWTLIDAGQRAQVMKKDPKKGGILQFGTEVVSSADGSIAGLLGASPGSFDRCPDHARAAQGLLPGRVSALGAGTPRPDPHVRREAEQGCGAGGAVHRGDRRHPRHQRLSPDRGEALLPLRAMNSGKSTSLLQAAYNYEERGQHVLLAKPAIDTKGASEIESRLGVTRPVDFLIGPDDDARVLFAEHRARMQHSSDDELLPAGPTDVACLLIDEAQFLTPPQVDDLFASRWKTASR